MPSPTSFASRYTGSPLSLNPFPFPLLPPTAYLPQICTQSAPKLNDAHTSFLPLQKERGDGANMIMHTTTTHTKVIEVR